MYYFGRSKRTNNGVRLAKKHGMDQELLSLALQASLVQPSCQSSALAGGAEPCLLPAVAPPTAPL